ncbi:MAG: gluconokinase [Salinibacter sp.]
MASSSATTGKNQTPVLILMGVSGAGKTTVGRRLADALDWDFVDGDDFHPPENVEKMNRGEPLTDEDRGPWLRSIRDFIHERLSGDTPTIIACSALKAAYREVLLQDNAGAKIVFLEGSKDLIRQRMRARTDHFFDAELLDSQFDVLEEPTEDAALTVNVDASPEAIVRTIRRELPALFYTSE